MLFIKITERKENEPIPLAAFKSGKLFAPLTFEGGCNRDFMTVLVVSKINPSVEAR